MVELLAERCHTTDERARVRVGRQVVVTTHDAFFRDTETTSTSRGNTGLGNWN